jgi:hypothetical protein
MLLVQVFQLAGPLHQFQTKRLEFMRSLQVRAVMSEASATLRLLAQVSCIGPNPGIGFSGTRYHRLARRYFQL